MSAPKEQEAKERGSGAIADVRESVSPDQHPVPVTLRDPYHQPHLQNFFDAVRGKAKLNCPAEVGYETAVTVLKVNEAIDAKQRVVPARRLQDLGSRTWSDDRFSAAAMIAITVLRVADRLALPLRGPLEADVPHLVGAGLPEAVARTFRGPLPGMAASPTCSTTRT